MNTPETPSGAGNTPAAGEVVIPREEAVFRMDAHGNWYNAGGRFRHKKIIDHFNRCIRSDENGFFLYQENGSIREKIYFPYEETALFVVDVEPGDPIRLVLNTEARIDLSPRDLFIRNDLLYMDHGPHIIKFRERAMMRMAEHILLEEGRYWFNQGKTRVELAVRQD